MNSSGQHLPPALCQTLHHTQTLILSSQEMGMVGVISQARERGSEGCRDLPVGWFGGGEPGYTPRRLDSSARAPAGCGVGRSAMQRTQDLVLAGHFPHARLQLLGDAIILFIPQHRGGERRFVPILQMRAPRLRK